MGKKKPEPVRPAAIPYPRVYEYYGAPHVDGRREPSCVNHLTYRRYRVTVELIDEPVDVLRERLRMLWRTEEYNYHYTDVFRKEAAALGFELDPKERAVDWKCRR